MIRSRIAEVVEASENHEKLSYEESARNLETACSLLKEESITLENAIEVYQAGNVLATHCAKKLERFRELIDKESDRNQEA